LSSYDHISLLIKCFKVFLLIVINILRGHYLINFHKLFTLRCPDSLLVTKDDCKNYLKDYHKNKLVNFIDSLEDTKFKVHNTYHKDHNY